MVVVHGMACCASVGVHANCVWFGTLTLIGALGWRRRVLESLPCNKQAKFAWRACSSPVPPPLCLLPPPSCSHVAALEGEFSPDSFAYGGVFSPDASYMSGGGAGASSTGVTVVHTDPTQHPAYVSCVTLCAVFFLPLTRS